MDLIWHAPIKNIYVKNFQMQSRCPKKLAVYSSVAGFILQETIIRRVLNIIAITWISRRQQSNLAPESGNRSQEIFFELAAALSADTKLSAGLREALPSY